jgi:cytochrome c553
MDGGTSRALAVIAAASFLALLAVEGSARAEEPYVPGLGDFMTAYVQTHHIKVGLAGAAGNWGLAEYEAKELRETFEDVSAYQGTWHDYPIAKMVESTLIPPLDALDAAIKARNASEFQKAYGTVTAACNTCHQATGNAHTVIKVPSASSFPDQDFRAP